MIALLEARRAELLARDIRRRSEEPHERLPAQVKRLAPQLEPVYFTLQS
jgi:hypothetical protein